MKGAAGLGSALELEKGRKSRGQGFFLAREDSHLRRSLEVLERIGWRLGVCGQSRNVISTWSQGDEVGIGRGQYLSAWHIIGIPVNYEVEFYVINCKGIWSPSHCLWD